MEAGGAWRAGEEAGGGEESGDARHGGVPLSMSMGGRKKMRWRWDPPVSEKG